MKRFKLLLLDANVVITLFEEGIWEAVCQECDVHLARTVLDEAQFYEDDEDCRHEIDLDPFITSETSRVVETPTEKVQVFLDLFDPSYRESLDPGEAESLAYLLESEHKFTICSADAIVFRVLGNLDHGDRGVSLEKLLSRLGLGRRLSHRGYTEAFREKHTRKGVAERLQGRGAASKE